MTLSDFIKLLESRLCANTENFEVEIDLDHCESPKIIKIEVDYEEETVTIIKGNRGT